MEQNKRIRKVVNSITSPSKDCLWLRDGKLYYYSTSGWTEIECDSDVKIQDIIEAEITENGEVTITPSEGYDATLGVKVNVDISNPVDSWMDVDGMTYCNSKISKFQDGYKFAPRTGVNCEKMFQNCENLTDVKLFDTSNATDMNNMFYSCKELNIVPFFNTSGVKNMYQMFCKCYKLTTIPQFDTSKVTNTWNMFLSCNRLTTVPKLDVSKVTNASNMFASCYKLTTLGGLTGLKDNLDLSDSPLLTHESLLNVINEAADVTASPKTLTLDTTNLAKLTDEEKAIATNKGWTLA